MATNNTNTAQATASQVVSTADPLQPIVETPAARSFHAIRSAGGFILPSGAGHASRVAVHGDGFSCGSCTTPAIPEAVQSTISINGDTLTLDELDLAGCPGSNIEVPDSVWEKLECARAYLLSATKGKAVYGVNTGFGSFAKVSIPKEDLAKLQLNLIRSHAVGVGDPLAPPLVRMLLCLRINTLAKGFSGVRRETLERMVQAFNAGCIPRIPCQGTVGASGDLCQLAHLALGLLGEGDMWDEDTNHWAPAAKVMEKKGCPLLTLQEKEGLALINGTGFITCITAVAYMKARSLLQEAIIVACLSIEALKGTDRAFDPRIHAARSHPGQIKVAALMRELLCPYGEHSEIHQTYAAAKVQDAYTLRCIPQVYGVCMDTLNYVEQILRVELNAATDNPMIFTNPGDVISGGNFHAEYPAKAADILAIAIQDIANMSERRTFRLTTSALSGHPSFLIETEKAGLNSGYMIVQYAAAAITSENKVLCHPASTDTIPTSEGQEDHVSMGGFAARKALTVVENVEKVVGMELLCACQALEFLRPAKTTPPLEAVHDLLRKGIPKLEEDHYLSPDIHFCIDLIRNGQLGSTVHQCLRPSSPQK